MRRYSGQATNAARENAAQTLRHALHGGVLDQRYGGSAFRVLPKGPSYLQPARTWHSLRQSRTATTRDKECFDALRSKARR